MNTNLAVILQANRDVGKTEPLQFEFAKITQIRP